MLKISFELSIFRMNGQNFTKFCIHIMIDKIYVGIVKLIFCKFVTELRRLIDIRIWFLLNTLRMNGQNLTKFCIHITIDQIYIWIVKHHFLKICNRVMALDLCQNLVFSSPEP